MIVSNPDSFVLESETQSRCFSQAFSYNSVAVSSQGRKMEWLIGRYKESRRIGKVSRIDPVNNARW